MAFGVSVSWPRAEQQAEFLSAQREKLAPMIAERLGEHAFLCAAAPLQTGDGARARAGAQRATSLKDLIARMEADSAAARAHQEAARKADDERAKAQAEPFRARAGSKRCLRRSRDPARLAPAVAFDRSQRAGLPAPAAGPVVRRFRRARRFWGEGEGPVDRRAAKMASLSPLATDGSLFSGPYRSYGQLLIINAGGGYYVVLAGIVAPM